MLRITNLSKTYGGSKKAVDDLTLDVPTGEIVGFIGHNGAGKTTTIKAVAGILDFEEGEIEINGISVKKSPLKTKQITAYIPDNPDLYEHMTGIQYLSFVADIYGVEQAERERLVKEYASAFELTKNLGDDISTYSHGMKQKLAVIAALVHSPKLMVMDEPFVGLDPKASHTLKLLMREICDAGGAIFFSTHVLEVAEKLCDKVIIIQKGKLVVEGTMEEVKGDSSLEDVYLELVADHE